jgi:formyl-CoA transferase
MSQIVAAPFAGVNLADLGADVVKIEPPGGDGTRVIGGIVPGESKAFHTLNRGKRGIVLDMQKPEAQAVVHRIIPQFDVFMINSRAGVAGRIAVDYETLTRFRPDLIYMENTGYGNQGPSATRSGSDVVAQAYSGLMAAEAKVDEFGAPLAITSSAIADYATGFAAAMAISAALYRRQLSGKGECIETSLLNTALTIQGMSVARMPVSDELLVRPMIDQIEAAKRSGAGYEAIAGVRRSMRGLTGAAFMLYYGGYQVKDGGLILGALTPANREQIRRVLGITDDPSASPDFNALDPVAQAAIDALGERIRNLMRTKTMDEWIELFDREGAPVSKVNQPEEMADDPQVVAMGYMRHIEHPLTGPEDLVGPVARTRNFPIGSDRSSPMLGEHTDEVLSQAGLSADDLAALRASGATI